MPIYEYRCTTCERHLEQNQSFSDEPLTTCPTCGGTLRKVFGSVGIVLKGSGFYRTDSRTSATRTAAKDNGTSTSSSDGSSSSEGSSSSSEGSSPGGTPAPKSEPSSNGSSSTPSPASTGSSASTGSTAGSS